MDTEQEIKQLKATIASYEMMLIEAAVPIIPSILENTILVPLIGHTGKDHFVRIQTRVLSYIGDNRDVECAVFDFTGIAIDDRPDYDYNVLAREIGNLNSALKLMGIRPIYVGFHPSLVRAIVWAGVQVDIETFVNFRTALAVMINEKGNVLHSL